MTMAERKAFLKDKDYGYNTDTEKALLELEKKAEEEHYKDALSKTLAELKAEFEKNKSADLDRHKNEVIELLETEIASRYYYDRAFVETTFDDDTDVQEALALFENPTRYQALLKGK